MPEYLPRAPKTYDAAQLDKMFEALLTKIAEFSQALTEVASDNNRAIGLLPDNRLYQLIDADRKSVVLALKSRGRLHRVQMESSGVSSPSGGVAPADAQYIVSVADSDLPNADVLTGTANQITVTNGAGTSTLATPQNIHTAATPQFARLGLGAAADGTLSINATNGAKLDGAVTINDSGADVDTRIEGDTDANLLMVDASADTVQIGSAATADSAKFYVNGKLSTAGEVEINGALNHDGSTVGFYGVTPAARPSAYTQTYATATRTHANPTATALTDSSGGTANTTVQALTDPADTPLTADALRDDLVANLIPELRNNFADLVVAVNALIVDVANAKQVLNSVLDDQQTLGLLQ